MRIISNFKDYYDNMQSFDPDDPFIYLRNEDIEWVKKYPFAILDDKFGSYFDPIQAYVTSCTIGFCGKIYPLLKVDFAGNSKGFKAAYRNIRSSNEALCHSLDDVDKVIARRFKKDQIAAYHRRGNRSVECLDFPRYFQRDKVQEFFEWHRVNQDKFKDLFLDRQSPIFCSVYEYKKGPRIIWNSNLEDVEFFRQFDTVSAFQEIEMFLGGMASPEKEIPEIDDKTMVGAKGFDVKHSFRKAPKKKKRNK